ncbi:hypothetical protein ACIKTA_00345 [Hansschlegelia beijingensis]
MRGFEGDAVRCAAALRELQEKFLGLHLNSSAANRIKEDLQNRIELLTAKRDEAASGSASLGHRSP